MDTVFKVLITLAGVLVLGAMALGLFIGWHQARNPGAHLFPRWLFRFLDGFEGSELYQQMRRIDMVLSLVALLVSIWLFGA